MKEILHSPPIPPEGHTVKCKYDLVLITLLDQSLDISREKEEESTLESILDLFFIMTHSLCYLAKILLERIERQLPKECIIVLCCLQKKGSETLGNVIPSQFHACDLLIQSGNSPTTQSGNSPTTQSDKAKCAEIQLQNGNVFLKAYKHGNIT